MNDRWGWDRVAEGIKSEAAESRRRKSGPKSLLAGPKWPGKNGVVNMVRAGATAGLQTLGTARGTMRYVCIDVSCTTFRCNVNWMVDKCRILLFRADIQKVVLIAIL